VRLVFDKGDGKQPIGALVCTQLPSVGLARSVATPDRDIQVNGSNNLLAEFADQYATRRRMLTAW
jgi:hypothetical protein